MADCKWVESESATKRTFAVKHEFAQAAETSSIVPTSTCCNINRFTVITDANLQSDHYAQACYHQLSKQKVLAHQEGRPKLCMKLAIAADAKLMQITSSLLNRHLSNGKKYAASSGSRACIDLIGSRRICGEFQKIR